MTVAEAIKLLQAQDPTLRLTRTERYDRVAVYAITRIEYEALDESTGKMVKDPSVHIS